MKNKTNYKRIFLEALRTAVIFVSGFLIYEFLLELEKKWNEMYPNNHMYHFHKRNSIKFIFIFIIDLLILLLFHRLGII